MDRDRHVGEHGFGTRGRDLDIVEPVFAQDAVGQRIAEVPEAALHFARFDFKVGNRGLEPGSQLTSRLSR
jgi:hypothetical protein